MLLRDLTKVWISRAEEINDHRRIYKNMEI